MNDAFCSESSRRRSESLYGTASRVKRWMLLEYPGVWAANAIEGSALPSHVKSQLGAICAATPGLRQVFVRQSHRRSDLMRCFTLDSSETPSGIERVDLSVCEDIAGFDFSRIAGHPRAQTVEGPLFLVCTHGNHDKCCAKFGIPVYDKLKKVAGERAWQCSHIGGDRFAGNLICLPHGIYYGHVTPADVLSIVEAYRRGEVYLKNYRGRSCYSLGAQVGEYFLRRESGRLGLDEFTFQGGSRAETWTMRFTGIDGAHEVTFRPRKEPEALLTCRAETPQAITQYDLLNYTAVK